MVNLDPHAYLHAGPAHLSALAPFACLFSLWSQARAVEEWCVSKWQQAGVQLPPHPLIPTPAQLAGFIREPSSSTSDITQ